MAVEKVPSVKTKDLIEALAEQKGLTKKEAKENFEFVLDEITRNLVEGKVIDLPGFGKLQVKVKPARTGRNPSTGETIKIKASKKLNFRPAKALKEAVAK